MKAFRFLVFVLTVIVTNLSFYGLAHAWELEAGLGFSKTEKQPNGTWYQEGFPYTLDLKKKSFYIGARHQIRPDLSAHINYVHFGVLHADAIATTDDNYDPATHGCVGGKCVAQSHFVGSGLSDGIKFAAEWDPYENGFGLIGGLFLFHPRWCTTVYDWTLSTDMPPSTIQHCIKNRWTIRPVIGVAYRVKETGPGWMSWFKGAEFRLEKYYNAPYDSSNTGIGKSTIMLSVGFPFDF